MGCIEIAVMASAAIIGPVVAVLISLWVQSRMEARHRQFQNEFAKQIEEERRHFELTRADAQEKFFEAWKIANRDRVDKVLDEMKRIADVVERLLKQTPR